MVSVRVNEKLLGAPLQESIRYTREGGSVVLILPPGGTVQDTLKENGVVLTQPVIALINERTADITQVLKADDRVRLLPQIAGG